MNWAQFKDLVSHMCLAGAVLASWSLTQELAFRKNSIVLRKTQRSFQLRVKSMYMLKLKIQPVLFPILSMISFFS